MVEPYGLIVLGNFPLPGSNGDTCGILVGNAGSAMWLKFRRSPEYSDGYPDPLDRWSRRIGETIARELEASVVFPFEGPPYPPFLAWAKSTGRAFSSPLSMFIHWQFGLWHAYRFALRLDKPVSGQLEHDEAISPCLSCVERPCLDTCPAGAFFEGEYRVNDCVEFLAANETSGCRERGCRARRACPVVPENHYLPEHARFHMDAFIGTEFPGNKKSMIGKNFA